jgi:hypothetical protein
MTPNEMRALKVIAGQSLGDVLGGDVNDAELMPTRLQALVWVALRRAGYEVTWEQAGDVAASTDAPAPDPTTTGS